jgi:hypothetical protein
MVEIHKKALDQENGQHQAETVYASPEHSPLPWQVTTSGDAGALRPVPVMGCLRSEDDPEKFIWIDIALMSSDHAGYALNNANFVVKACNHFEKLLAAAKHAAEAPGKDWLREQLRLCEVISEIEGEEWSGTE